jgi:hypothetical protein
MVQWGLDGGGAMMGLCRVVAPSDTAVASMADLVKGFASSNTPEMGWRKEVMVTFGVCAQGAFFGLYQGVVDGGG